MHRIAVFYDKDHPRMSGNRIKRGCWRVAYCGDDIEPDAHSAVQCYIGYLYMNSVFPRKVGTLVNPRAVLAEYQHNRHLCRMVNYIGYRVPV